MNNNSSHNKDGSVLRERPPSHWHWVVVLGVVLVVFGVVGTVFSLSWEMESLLLVGWFLFASGLLQGLHTFSRHIHRVLSLGVVDSSIYLVSGLLIVSDPIAGTLELTLLMSGMLMVRGLIRILLAGGTAIGNRLPVIASGVVALILGIILWLSWPSTGLLVLGTFISVDIGVTGWEHILIGFYEKRLLKSCRPRVVQT